MQISSFSKLEKEQTKIEMKKIFFYTLFLFINFSCKTKQVLTNSQVLKFEGNFSNVANEPEHNVSPSTKAYLGSFVKPFNFRTFAMDSLSTFEIKILDNKNLNLIIKNKNETRIAKVKYEYKNGTINIDKNKYNEGVPLIFHRYRNIQMKMFFNSTNDLAIEFNGEAGGGIFIMYFGGKIVENYSFKRI